jgi:proline iminopeptidase
MLDVGEGHRLYWETCGRPNGKPALVLHGGPGSGCTSWQRGLFDPARYRTVLFDQRNAGRSTPHASEPDVDLTHNTTRDLIDDIERLREHLVIDRWLVWGGSWGSVLALAYAISHPQRVTEMVLWGVATGRRDEWDWLFRGGLARFFPEEWQRLVDAVPAGRMKHDIVETYAELLFDRDPEIRRRAAFEWCLWESATPAWPPTAGLAEQYEDPRFALAFARLVTHYARHDGWVGDGAVLRDVGRLAEIPGVLVQGRFDFQSPLASAWALHRGWHRSELIVIGGAGHSPEAEMEQALVAATDRFASAGSRR